MIIHLRFLLVTVVLSSWVQPALPIAGLHTLGMESSVLIVDFKGPARNG
ncbi:hypothetical protein [Proteus mirabilis]